MRVLITLANTSAPYIVSGLDSVRVAVDADGTGEFRFIETGCRIRGRQRLADRGLPIGRQRRRCRSAPRASGHPFRSLLQPHRRLRYVRIWLCKGFSPSRSPLASSTDEPWRAVVELDSRPKPGFLLAAAQWLPWSPTWRCRETRPVECDLEIRSLHPCPVTPRYRRTYWGDIQSHSAISKDAIGLRRLPLCSRRDATRLLCLHRALGRRRLVGGGAGRHHSGGVAPDPGAGAELLRSRELCDPPGLRIYAAPRSPLHLLSTRSRGPPFRRGRWTSSRISGGSCPREMPSPSRTTWDGVTGPVREAVEGPELEQIRFGVKKKIRRGPVLNWSHAHEQTYPSDSRDLLHPRELQSSSTPRTRWATSTPTFCHRRAPMANTTPGTLGQRVTEWVWWRAATTTWPTPVCATPGWPRS